jgi:hypothetical protein
MLDWQTSEPDALSVGGEAGWFTLDGVVVTGRGVQVSGDVSGVTIRNCTLVPGWGLECDCEPKHPSEPSLEIIGAPLCVTIEHSILGPIRIERDEVAEDPVQIRINDSIVDGMSETGVALGTSGKLCAHSALSLWRCTVIGQVQTHLMEIAEDSILLGTVMVCRRQRGCVRFCYVAAGSRTPRRFECQPDMVVQAVDALLTAGDVTQAQHDALVVQERLRVEPEFDSLRYGAPAYCRLTATCAAEIATGASDGAEMGVFHDLYQPQRLGNLRQRLNEYTPAGNDVGIIFAS